MAHTFDVPKSKPTVIPDLSISLEMRKELAFI
jgi:hypothetical protein